MITRTKRTPNQPFPGNYHVACCRVHTDSNSLNSQKKIQACSLASPPRGQIRLGAISPIRNKNGNRQPRLSRLLCNLLQWVMVQYKVCRQLFGCSSRMNGSSQLFCRKFSWNEQKPSFKNVVNLWDGSAIIITILRVRRASRSVGGRADVGLPSPLFADHSTLKSTRRR